MVCLAAESDPRVDDSCAGGSCSMKAAAPSVSRIPGSSAACAGISGIVSVTCSTSFMKRAMRLPPSETESSPPSRIPAKRDFLNANLLNIPCSIVPSDMKFTTRPVRCWPSRCTRPIRCSRTAGFQGRSRLIIVEAFWRLRPVPPASVERKTLMRHAAQLVARPGLKLDPKLGINAEQKGFAVFGGHRNQWRSPARWRTVSTNKEGCCGEMTRQRSGQRSTTAWSRSVT